MKNGVLFSLIVFFYTFDFAIQEDSILCKNMPGRPTLATRISVSRLLFSTWATTPFLVILQQRTYLTGNMLINRFRGGLSLQPELMFGKLTAGFHFGIYLFNPIKNLEPYNEAKTGTLNKSIIYPYDIEKEDGWLYTRASLKYSITPHLLLHLGLKTHQQKAEFIEWGIGYRL